MSPISENKDSFSDIKELGESDINIITIDDIYTNTIGCSHPIKYLEYLLNLIECIY